MATLPTALYSNEQIREIERIAIQDLKIGAYTLMERAGNGAFIALKQRWQPGSRVVIFCGKGNNGGDGYVVARLAKEQGYPVTVYYIGDLDGLKGAALEAMNAAQEYGVTIQPYDKSIKIQADVIVDGLLGTGLKDAVRGKFVTAIEQINDHPAPVLALDVPSGIDVDTGHVLGVAVKAAMTITFIGLKQGLFTGQSPDYTGEIRCESLEVPAAAFAKVKASVRRLLKEACLSLLPPRPPTAHKGSFGHVLVIGGDHGMAGAVMMAALAAARVGAGLVTVATRPEHVNSVNAFSPVLMCHPITQGNAIEPLLEKATTIVVGPGLGRSTWGRQLWQLAVDANLPMVVDADGLQLLAGLKQQSNQWILTPHPGEGAQLLAMDTQTIQRDRFAAAITIQQRYGGVCVLKGCGTIIQGSPDNDENATWLCTAGNPGMASGGMGDILSGVIGGLLAQGMAPLTAARVGTYLHAYSADMAAENGQRGLLATDLLPYLRRLIG